MRADEAGYLGFYSFASFLFFIFYFFLTGIGGCVRADKASCLDFRYVLSRKRGHEAEDKVLTGKQGGLTPRC